MGFPVLGTSTPYYINGSMDVSTGLGPSPSPDQVGPASALQVRPSSPVEAQVRDECTCMCSEGVKLLHPCSFVPVLTMTPVAQVYDNALEETVMFGGSMDLESNMKQKVPDASAMSFVLFVLVLYLQPRYFVSRNRCIHGAP